MSGINLQVFEIRMFNRMSSDYDVYCCKWLLILVKNLQFLVGKICYIEFDEYLKFEMVVLYL